MSRSWYNLGALYQRKGEPDSFLRILQERVLPIQSAIQDMAGLGKSYHAIGLILQNNQEYPRALEFHHKAIDVLAPLPSRPELIDTYSMIVECLYLQGNWNDNEIKLGEQSLDKAAKLLKQTPDPYSQILYLQAEGMFEEAVKKQDNSALSHYLEGHQLAQQYGMYQLGSKLLYRSFFVFERLGKYRSALTLLTNELEKYGKYLLPKDKAQILKNIVTCYTQLGEIDKAFYAQKEYVQLSDSLSKVEMAFKVKDLERKYETKAKEREIDRLSAEMESKELLVKRNRQGLLLLGGMVILLILIFWFAFLVLKKRQTITLQEKLLVEGQIVKLEQERQLTTLAAMMDGQENERKRIAIDLHDGLGGVLSSVKLKLSNIVHMQDELEKVNEEQNVINQVDLAIVEMRHIARHLMPETLSKFGLEMAMIDYCKSLMQQNLEISFQAYDLSKNIPQQIQIMLYRIMQELINNAIKHAEATQILVQCLQDGHNLTIVVEDNGKGFDPMTLENKMGIGLSNVKTRVDYLNASMDIASELGIGTSITIALTYV